MRCIFCLKERPPSIEHVFPDAIGGTLTIERVCKPCNDWLGANVDALLTDNDFIVLKRAELGMQHRDGSPVNPWTTVFRNATLVSDPDQRVQIVLDPMTGELQPRLLYKSVRTKLHDGSEAIQITLDASQGDEIGKIIQRERRRAGMDPLPDHELAALVAAANEQKRGIENPHVLHKPVFDMTHYRLGIFKIAYELAWLWLGDDYLTDPVAGQLRDIILRGGRDAIRGSIVLDGGQSAPFSLWNAEPNAHVAIGMRGPSFFSIGIRMFNIMSGTIGVTDSPERYALTGLGQFLLIDLTGGCSRRSTLEEEVTRMTRITPAVNTVTR